MNSALASLTATYTDSDISDEDEDSRPLTPMHKPKGSSTSDENSSQSIAGNRVSRLVSYVNDEDLDKDDEDYFDRSVIPERKLDVTGARPKPSNLARLEKEIVIEEDSKDSVKAFTSSLRTSSVHDIMLPPEPEERCSPELQEKFARHYEKTIRGGLDMNVSIQRRKDFRNPSIYEKLITYCLIDELGTNYPPDIYDPRMWKEESFYEELAKAQKVEMDKRQKERTKVEFVSGTKKTTVTPALNSENATDDGKKRKSKWDVGAVQPSVPVLKTFISHPPGIIPVTTTASGTKATVISAFGIITKKSKQ